MPDLDLLDSFRAGVSPAREESRAAARARLLAAIAANASAAERHGFPGRKRRVVAVLVVLGGLLALPSLGLGSRLVDLVRPDAHKPPTVRQELVNAGYLYGHDRTPGISQTIVSRERRLLGVSTDRGRAVLWAAPTRDGGACFVLRGARFKNGGCFGPESMADRLAPSLMGALGGRRSTSIVGARWAMLVGHAARPASHVELRYADGGRSVLPFNDGWFLFAVPSLHRTAGHEPVALVSLDVHGKVLASETRLFHPFASRP